MRQNQINIVLHDKRVTPTSNNKKAVNPFQPIDDAFADFVGLKQFKENIKEVYANVQINLQREKAGLKTKKQVLHMLFKGNPGTGKTTVARQLAELFHDLNMLSKGHFIEAERADLVGEYIGQTANKTRELVEKALGGILFIDEAYSLARGGEKDFGKEAIDTLVKQMEDYHQDFILILAGYPHEMDYFLSTNPGLASRFPMILDFEDYTVEQLIKIAKQMAQERDYQLSKEAEWKLTRYLTNERNSHHREKFANARLIRNIIEQTIRKQSMRLMSEHSYSTEQLMLLIGSDLCLT
nr:AAA family ATPase [Natronobacillus azotifigens]